MSGLADDTRCQPLSQRRGLRRRGLNRHQPNRSPSMNAWLPAMSAWFFSMVHDQITVTPDRPSAKVLEDNVVPLLRPHGLWNR